MIPPRRFRVSPDAGGTDLRIVGEHFGHQAQLAGGTSQGSVKLWTCDRATDALELYFGAADVDQKYSCAIEWPLDTPPVPATYFGAEEWTVAAGSNGRRVQAYLSIPAGATVRIHTRAAVVNGSDTLRVTEALLLAGESTTGPNEATDYTKTAGPIPGGVSGRTDGPANVATAGPTWIAARRRVGSKRTLMGAGDSNQRGIGIPSGLAGPAVTQRLNGFFALALRRIGHPNWINFSASNERISSLFDGQNNGNTTWQWKGKLATFEFVDDVFCNLATNDLADRTAVQICTYLNQFGQYLYGRGKRLSLFSPFPRTGTAGNMVLASTQQVQHIEKRSFICDWMRNGCRMEAGVPVLAGGVPSPYIHAVFDLSAWVEVDGTNAITLNGGRWLCRPAPKYAGLTVTAVSAVAGGVQTLTVSGGTLPAFNGGNLGLHTMVAVMRSGAASGQSAVVATGNLANTVPVYTNGTTGPTGVAVAGMTNTPAIGDTLDLHEVPSNDGTHPTLWLHSLAADGLVPWLYQRGFVS